MNLPMKKRKPGRPKLYAARRRAGIDLPVALWNEIVEISAREIRSANAQIVMWIMEGAAKYREDRGENVKHIEL